MYARLDAEAKGQLQLLQAKADGLRMIVDSCGGAQQAFQLLMLEHIEKLSENAAKSISNIKFDKIVVWDSGNNANGGNATSNFIRGVANSLPPALHLMKDIAGVEMPKYFGNILDENAGLQEHYNKRIAELNKSMDEETDQEKLEKMKEEMQNFTQKLDNLKKFAALNKNN